MNECNNMYIHYNIIESVTYRIQTYIIIIILFYLQTHDVECFPLKCMITSRGISFQC